MTYRVILTAGEGVPTRVFAGNYDTIEAAERQIARIEACVHHYKGHIEMAVTTAVFPDDIEIDEEFRILCPRLSEDERMQLAVNIERDGFRDPLVVWSEGNLLLDGHNRFEIWQSTYQDDDDYLPDVKVLHLPDREACINWIVDNQLGRRNLPPDARKILLGKKYNDRKKAKNDGGKGSKKTVRQTDGRSKSTAEQIGRDHGVSSRTVERAGKAAEAFDELPKQEQQAVMKGEKRLNDAKPAKSSNGAKRADTGRRTKPAEKKDDLEVAGKSPRFSMDEAGDEMRDWLRGELNRWPEECRDYAAHMIRQILEKEFNL